MEGVIRTQRVWLNLKWSALAKGGSILLNLAMVPALLAFLGKSEYGLWLTITSFLGWTALMDLGIGNGLKNKVAEALANGNDFIARRRVTSAYVIIGLIALTSFLVIFTFLCVYDWNSLLGANDMAPQRLRLILIVFFLLFCVRIFLNQLLNVAAATQWTAISEWTNFSLNAISLALVLTVGMNMEDSLFACALIFGLVPVVFLGVISCVAYGTRLKHLRPALRLFSWNEAFDTISLGSRFFIIQIAGIIIFSTDNLIISHLLGPAQVTPFHISFKYFGVVTILFGMISSSLWPAYTEAYQKKEGSWVSKVTNRLLRMWLLIIALVAIMLACAPAVLSLWVGEEVYIPFSLNFWMALYVIVLSWGSIYVTFINSTGKLKLQLICSVAAALINIPLSYFLVVHTPLGSTGVIIATIICLSYGPTLAWVQYRKILLGTAKGIWNK